MNTDDATRSEARALLERALEPEPKSTLDAEDVLYRARRGVRQRQTAISGAVAATVVMGAVAVGWSTGQVTGPVDQVITTTPSSTRPCLPGRCAQLPSDDPVSRRFTNALAAANVIPSGVRVLDDPRSYSDPLFFYRVLGGEPRASAMLEDSRGSSRFEMSVDKKPPASETWRCGAPKEGTTCVERTLLDGSQARVTTVSFVQKTVVLSVKRPNDTFIEAYCSNYDSLKSDTDHEATTRDEPILGVEDMFRIAGVTGLSY